MDESVSREQVFVVRIWQKASSTTQVGSWRGSIVHVQSRQRLYIASLNDLCDFITLRALHGSSFVPDARDLRIAELEAQLAEARTCNPPGGSD